MTGLEETKKDSKKKKKNRPEKTEETGSASTREAVNCGFGFRRSKRRRTRSLVWSTFRSNFFKRFSSTDSFVILLSHGIKKVGNSQKLNSRGGGDFPGRT